MASPQAENGHTDIANEISEAFQRLHLSGNQWKILWVILRQTYGWHKKMDQISISLFQKNTKLDRRNAVRALNELIARNIVVKDDSNFITRYGLQKDYSKWINKPLSIMTIKTVVNNDNSTKMKPLSKTTLPVVNNDNETVVENDTHKRKKL